MGSRGFEMREEADGYLTNTEKRSRVIGLSSAELRRCQRLFRVFDKDKDGAIDWKELLHLLKSIGCPASKDAAINMINDLDGDGNGHVDYHEFLEIMVDSQEQRNASWQNVIDALCEDPDFNKRRDDARQHVSNALRINRIRPESKLRCGLDALVAICIAYYYVIVLLEDCGKERYGYKTTDKIVWETVASVIFVVDALFVLNTAVAHEMGGRLLTARQEILRHYYSSGALWVDLLSSFPYDLIVPNFYVERVVRHFRLFKIFRFSSLFSIENTGLMSPQQVVFYFRIVPLFLNAIYCVFVMHTFSIIWLWLQDEEYGYLDAVYFILYTLTTVGYGDPDVNTDGQKGYACLLLVVGACLNGLTVGYLTAFIMRSDIYGDKVDKMRQTLAVLRHFKVPSSLQEEILSYQYHVLDHNLGIAYTDVIAGLPPTMQQQVSLYMRVRLVTQVPMFSVCELSVQIALAQSLNNIVVPPEEYIMVAGEDGNEMFFLSHGFCDVIAVNGQLLATITKGGFFGEVALLVDTERHTNVKALTFCDLFILQRTEFSLILDRFPSFASHIHDEIDRRTGGAKTETEALLAFDNDGDDDDDEAPAGECPSPRASDDPTSDTMSSDEAAERVSAELATEASAVATASVPPTPEVAGVSREPPDLLRAADEAPPPLPVETAAVAAVAAAAAVAVDTGATPGTSSSAAAAAVATPSTAKSGDGEGKAAKPTFDECDNKEAPPPPPPPPPSVPATPLVDASGVSLPSALPSTASRQQSTCATELETCGTSGTGTSRSPKLGRRSSRGPRLHRSSSEQRRVETVVARLQAIGQRNNPLHNGRYDQHVNQFLKNLRKRARRESFSGRQDPAKESFRGRDLLSATEITADNNVEDASANSCANAGGGGGGGGGSGAEESEPLRRTPSGPDSSSCYRGFFEEESFAYEDDSHLSANRSFKRPNAMNKMPSQPSTSRLAMYGPGSFPGVGQTQISGGISQEERRLLRTIQETQQVLRYSVEDLSTELRDVRREQIRQAHMLDFGFNRLARLIRDPTSTTPKGGPTAPIFDGELRGYDVRAPESVTLSHGRGNPNKVGFDLGESGASLPSVGVRERERERDRDRSERSFELRVPPTTRGGGRRRRRDRGDGLSSDASECEPDSPISPGPRSPGLR